MIVKNAPLIMMRLISAVAVSLIGVAPALAQNTGALVARGAEGLIRAYDPKVRDVQATIPAAPGTQTACGKVGSGNLTAFYCSDSRSIYINQITLDEVGNRFGPEGIATLVAHEYAHARLHAIQGFTRDFVWSSVIDEVQADCVAGVYLRNATPIPLTTSMVNNSADFVESIGDYLILEKDWHGTPQMRRTAFLHGYNQGKLSACVAAEGSSVNRLIDKSSDVIKDQMGNPESELNRLIRWGNNVIQN
jgi:hypothetical protein